MLFVRIVRIEEPPRYRRLGELEGVEEAFFELFRWAEVELRYSEYSHYGEFEHLSVYVFAPNGQTHVYFYQIPTAVAAWPWEYWFRHVSSFMRVTIQCPGCYIRPTDYYNYSSWMNNAYTSSICELECDSKETQLSITSPDSIDTIVPTQLSSLL